MSYILGANIFAAKYPAIICVAARSLKADSCLTIDMSRKRWRDVPAVDTQLVEIYDDLANEDEEIRLKAAQSLLQKASPSAGLTSEKLNEVLRRLIRGLCSGRKAARLGFSVALTEYLIQLLGPDSSYSSPPTTLHDVIKVLEKQTHIGSNVGGQV